MLIIQFLELTGERQRLLFLKFHRGDFFFWFLTVSVLYFHRADNLDFFLPGREILCFFHQGFDWVESDRVTDSWCASYVHPVDNCFLLRIPILFSINDAWKSILVSMRFIKKVQKNTSIIKKSDGFLWLTDVFCVRKYLFKSSILSKFNDMYILKASPFFFEFFVYTSYFVQKIKIRTALLQTQKKCQKKVQTEYKKSK